MTEVEKLSRQFEARLSALDTRYKDLEAALIQKTEAINKNIDSLEANLDNAKKSLAQIVSQATKKDQTDSGAKLDEALVPIRSELNKIASLATDLDNIKADAKTLEKTLKGEVAGFSASVSNISKGLAKIESDVSAKLDQKVDKETLDLELLIAKKNYQQNLERAISNVENKLGALEKRIGNLTGGATLGDQGRPTSFQNTLPSQSLSRQRSEELPLSVKPPENIVEQNISE
ncbi:MAG: hypothetical protein JSW39_11665 [Desulfobacterales bacterium]|nr:MAG: hypothetical protein JSW39_11665 [Desulfobacterales bacterium]